MDASEDSINVTSKEPSRRQPPNSQQISLQMWESEMDFDCDDGLEELQRNLEKANLTQTEPGISGQERDDTDIHDSVAGESLPGVKELRTLTRNQQLLQDANQLSKIAVERQDEATLAEEKLPLDEIDVNSQRWVTNIPDESCTIRNYKEFRQEDDMTTNKEIFDMNYSYHTGCQLISDPSLAIKVASLLQKCFPVILTGMSTHETLQDGIGFHDMKDTTWILLQRNTALTKTSLIGMATTIGYHNGLYVCNLCVSPVFQGRGFALNLLEAAALITVAPPEYKNDHTEQNIDQKNGSITAFFSSKGRLIGHADANNHALLDYYTRLGAEKVQTGIFNNNTTSEGSHVRLEREIPDTAEGLLSFFSAHTKCEEEKETERLLVEHSVAVIPWNCR